MLAKEGKERKKERKKKKRGPQQTGGKGLKEKNINTRRKGNTP